MNAVIAMVVVIPNLRVFRLFLCRAECYVPDNSLRMHAISLFDLANHRPLRAHIARQIVLIFSCRNNGLIRKARMDGRFPIYHITSVNSKATWMERRERVFILNARRTKDKQAPSIAHPVPGILKAVASVSIRCKEMGTSIPISFSGQKVLSRD